LDFLGHFHEAQSLFHCVDPQIPVWRGAQLGAIVARRSLLALTIPILLTFSLCVK